MEWISVKTALPPYNEEVLLLIGNRVTIGKRKRTDVNGDWFSDSILIKESNNFDFWMPLPEPPKK